MKKFLTFIICLLIILSASACKSSNAQQNNDSSESNSRNSVTLIRALTGTDDITVIESLVILHEYSPKETIITDSKDWSFLEKYTYSDRCSTEELDEVFTFPKTNIINIKINGFENTLYLMKDGSIVKREMCGDSGVKEEDRSYEVYKADNQYMLDEERLIDLLKKYDNNVTNTIESNNKIESVKLEYITTTCQEAQARTKISVVDGTVYCMWVDVTYNDDGRDSETYVLDAFENGSWKNVSKQEYEFEGSPYFEKTYEYPLFQKVGDKIIWTDPDNNFYLYDTSNGKNYDLEMNLSDWRAFATDNENVFAVLSAYTNGYGKIEIRIYDISKIEK